VDPPGCYRSHPSPNLNEADVSDKPAWVQALSPTQHSDAARKQQEQNLLAVDDSVRNIMQAVADRGELSNTVFVFTSDNSLSGGSHRWPAKETGWDEALHVPLVVRYDALTAGSTNATDMVLNADFTPSAVDIAGLAQDTSFDGSSWLPLLTNPGAPWRTAFPIEHLAQGTSNPPTYCGVRTDGWPELSGRWKYLRYINGEQELYDLVADPFELQSLHADPAYATQLQKLHDLAQQLCNPPPPGYGW
jgi:arylsulfatase A-like enzyme